MCTPPPLVSAPLPRVRALLPPVSASLLLVSALQPWMCVLPSLSSLLLPSVFSRSPLESAQRPGENANIYSRGTVLELNSLPGHPTHIVRNQVTRICVLGLTRGKQQGGVGMEFNPSQLNSFDGRSQSLGEISATITSLCTFHYICSLSVSHMIFIINGSAVVRMLLF